MTLPVEQEGAGAHWIRMLTRELPLLEAPLVMVGEQPKRNARRVDEYGRTPLHYACRDGNSALCAELLAAGGWTPLHFAAQAQSAPVTKLLIKASTDLDVRDGNGNTPLWRATMTTRGQGDVICLLRAAGADPCAKNNAGISPVSLARTIANFPLAQFFSDLPSDA
jgi:ankyrin repeat protein